MKSNLELGRMSLSWYISSHLAWTMENKIGYGKAMEVDEGE